jgi:putative peptidoglycan lipid II flippase
MLSVVVNVVAAVTLMGPLRHGGLALASSLGAWVNFVALVWVARHRFGGLESRRLGVSLGRTAVASGALAAWCLGWLWMWPPAAPRLLDAAWLAGAVLGGGVVFWVASAVLGAPERRALLGLRGGWRQPMADEAP